MSEKRFSKAEVRMAEDVFGDFNRFEAWTDDHIQEGDFIVMVNSNCEFELDNRTGNFTGKNFNSLIKCFVCKLELKDVDYSNFVPEKSNNGGCYAFATAKVVKILDETY